MIAARTFDLAGDALRERAVRTLWLAFFDSFDIATLLGMPEHAVAAVIAKRETDVPDAADAAARARNDFMPRLPR